MFVFDLDGSSDRALGIAWAITLTPILLMGSAAFVYSVLLHDMRLNLEYDPQTDFLDVTGGKPCPVTPEPYRPGINKLRSKVTFNIVGVRLTGFKRNWGQAPPDRVCDAIAHELGCEPGEILLALTSMTPGP